MKYELICADIDGTLLDDEKRLQPQVRESLQRAAKAGIKIALVSGRMPSGVSVAEQALGIECIKVCHAGSYILMGETCIGSEHLPNSTMLDIYKKAAEANGIPLWIFQEKEWFVTDVDEFIEKECGYVAYHPKLVNVKEMAAKWEQEGKYPNKLLIAAEANMLQDIYRELRNQAYPQIDLACSSDTYLEICPKGVNKGKALTAVCQKLGVPPERTIAFGDHELDIPLIEAAGVGIAMGNAIGKLKEKADFVTKTNNEAGIAYALEHYLGKQEGE